MILPALPPDPSPPPALVAVLDTGVPELEEYSLVPGVRCAVIRAVFRTPCRRVHVLPNEKTPRGAIWLKKADFRVRLVLDVSQKGGEVPVQRGTRGSTYSLPTVRDGVV